MAGLSVFQVPRMNFLKAERFSLNYAVMASIVMACIFLMGAWFGVTMLRISMLQKDIAAQQASLKQMEEEKEKRLSYAKLAGKKFQAKSAEREFKSIFTNPPPVAEFLAEVAKQLPPQLQLLEVKLEKGAEEGGYKLSILGKGKNPRLLSNYTSRLEDSVYFKNVKLIATEHESKQMAQGQFRFSIEAEALPTI